MTPEIIPITVEYNIDPYQYQMRGDRPRQFIEQDLKKRVADAIVQYVTIEEIDGPYCPPYLRAQVFLARGYGEIQSEIQMQMAIAQSKIDQDRSWNDIARANNKVRELALKQAEANFRERLQDAFAEFRGYDECVGRR